MQFNTTRYIDENQDDKTLKDVSKSGKQRPWREKKIDNVSYADILEILKIKKAFNVKQCGNVLEFKPTDEGYLKLYKTWFCKSKLCPVCNWRRSMKNSYQAQKVIEEVIKEKPKARWLFLTLSTKNAIDGEHLEQSLKHMSKAFNKLKMYAKVKKNLIGFMRSTEVTVNKNDGSYNQHMHVLLCVENAYFRKKKIILLKKSGSIYGKKHFKLITNLSQISKQLSRIKKAIKIYSLQSKRHLNIL